MKRILFCMAMLCSCLCVSAQKPIARSIFDLNGDNRIDIADVTRLINRICGKKEGDSIVITIAKVDTIHYVVTDTIYEHIKVYVKDTIYVADIYTLDGVEYVMPEAVDLGLPSGNLWASLDLGTNSLEEKNRLGGLPSAFHFDISTPEDWINPWSGTEYDITSTTLGNGWRSPTIKDFQELIDNCTFEPIDYHYAKVTGKNGNSIVLVQYENILEADYSCAEVIYPMRSAYFGIENGWNYLDRNFSKPDLIYPAAEPSKCRIRPIKRKQ